MMRRTNWKVFPSTWDCIFKLFLGLLAFIPLRLAAQDSEPYVSADGSVTFTLHAPGAKKARLILGDRKYKMEQQGDNFTYHTVPLSPEMYTYEYVVDGRVMADPKNSRVTRDVEKRLNYFFVAGGMADHYVDKDIPHGTLSKVWYPSTLNGMSQRRLCVYTPPGYDDHPEESYPVLYLLHGSGGDETTWADGGRVCQILDDLIHTDSIKPLVVVMPNGNIELDAAPGESPYMDKLPSGNNVNSMVGKFEKLFVKEIVGFTEKNYRVRKDKAHRAIAGLSMGGLHALFISLNHPQLFDYVGLFSAQTSNMLTERRIYKIERFNYNRQRIRNIAALIGDRIPAPISLSDKLSCLDIYENIEQKLAQQFSPAPRLYYMAIGRDDFLNKMNSQYRSLLASHGYPYTFVSSEGGHSWENWRRYLVDFLQRIFYP